MTQETNLIPIDSRAEALEVVGLVTSNAPISTLAPYIRSLMTHDYEQSFAIMRGSGNEMSSSLQLLCLLESRDFISMDEVFAAEEARLDAEAGRKA